MKKSLISEIIFMIILGSLAHFAYHFANCNQFVGFFVPVNESIFEHTKLFIVPFLLLSIFQLYTKNITNSFYFSKFISLFIMMTGVIVFYYAYTSIIKGNLIIDILIFIICCIIGILVDHKLQQINANILLKYIGIIGLLLITFFVVKWTLNPPELEMFKSSVLPTCPSND